MKRENDPAFPEPYINNPDFALSIKPGLTKREYFAGLAMQGLIANNQMVSAIITASKKDERAATIAECSIDIADELLKQLSQ